MNYKGWVHFDGSAICPRCNKWIPCDEDIPSILAAPLGHSCEDDPGIGHWFPDPVPGHYWIEPDGSRVQKC